MQATAFQDAPDGDRGALVTIDEKASQLWAATALRDIGIVLLAFVALLPLPGHALPQQLPGIVGPLIPLGPVLLVAASILGQADLGSIASDFTDSGVTEGGAGEERAENLLDDRSAARPRGGRRRDAGAGALPRAREPQRHAGGLLSRFMGIIGIITGALLVLPLSPLPVVQIFWLGALGGALPRPLARRARPGLGERRGRALALGRAAARARRSASGCASIRAGARGRPTPEPSPRREHPVSQKRKRKRRR